MIALMKYLFVYYVRSYRYVAPFLAYTGVLLFIYSVVPNPVLDSYAFSGMWLFVASAWFSYGYTHFEHEAQRWIAVVQARSVAAYYGAKLLLLGAICAVLAAATVAYPIVGDKFDRQPSAAETIAALGAHLALAWLGIACALFFSERWIASRSLSLLGLLLLLALALGGQGAAEALPPSVRFALWLAPPAFRVSDALVHMDELTPARIVFILGFAAAYAGAIALVFIRTMKRRLF